MLIGTWLRLFLSLDVEDGAPSAARAKHALATDTDLLLEVRRDGLAHGLLVIVDWILDFDQGL
jgi:hypothetical protein